MMEVKYTTILKGIDLSERRLPILIERAKEPGPTIWLCGATHGNEVTGIEVIHRIFNFLKRNPLKKGALYAAPVINPLGFEMVKRENPYDGEDINRNFPGDNAGDTTERLTNAVFNSIAETKPDLVVDLHSDTLNSIPYIIIDRPVGARTGIIETIKKSWILAEKFGVTVTYDLEEEGYKKYSLDKSLTAALVNRAQIPAFLVELGGPNVIHEGFVRIGTRGLKNLLAYFDMIQFEEGLWVSETKIKTDGKLELTGDVVSNEAGIIEYLAKPGEFIKAGQPLAKINNILGKVEETIFAKRDCYIISLIDQSVSFPGLEIITAAVIEKKEKKEEARKEKTEKSEKTQNRAPLIIE